MEEVGKRGPSCEVRGFGASLPKPVAGFLALWEKLGLAQQLSQDLGGTLGPPA